MYRSTIRQKHSRDSPRAPDTAPTCSLEYFPVPSTCWDNYPPMESLHGRAQPRAASERSRSRLTRHGARDDTKHKRCNISMRQASTHALPCAPSCTGLRIGSVPTPRSGSPPAPTTYARLQPHLPTAELQAPQAARRAWSELEKIDRRMVSRPSCLPT